MPRAGSTCGGEAPANRSSGSPSRTIMAATSHSVPTAICTSGWATVGANDPQHRAQNRNTLLGKMLRIDINVADRDPTGYTIPPDNPFLGSQPVPALPEIWSIGLRNPWRYSFDDPALGGTGALIIADVGQDSGRKSTTSPATAAGATTAGETVRGRIRTSDRRHRLSAAGRSHSRVRPLAGAVDTGGFMYRGRALGHVAGRYFFADYVTGRVWSMGLTVNARPARPPWRVMDHTAALGGARRSATSVHSASTRTVSCTSSATTAGASSGSWPRRRRRPAANHSMR